MAKNSFWNSFKRETGKNTGKWLSNNLLGNGWSTPSRHEIIEPTEQTKDADESAISSHTSNDVDIHIKNVQTNEHDVNIAEINARSSEIFFDKTIVIEQRMNRKGLLLTFGIISILVLSVFLLHTTNENKKLSDSEIQLQLEKKEIQILQYIKTGEKEKALDIIPELTHPSDKPMPNNGNLKDWLNQSTYSNYWNLKRQQLMNEALKN